MTQGRWISNDELLAAEAAMYERFYEAVKEFAPHAADLWGIGDGEGGWVWLKLQGAVFEIIGEPAPRVSAPRRKKLIDPDLRRSVYERDEYRCKGCGSWVDLTIDHVLPEVAGGATELENLQTLCRPCNSSKGTRMPDPGP